MEKRNSAHPGLVKMLFAVIAVISALLCSGASPANAGTGGKIYISLNYDGGIAVVDADTLDAWGTIKTGNITSRMRVSPDKKFVYVAVYGDNKVKRIDVSTDAVDKEITVGPGPYAMDITPDGKRLIVGTDTSVSVIDTETFKEAGRLGLDGMSQVIRVAPDGKTAYIVAGEESASLVALNIEGMKISRRMALPEMVYGMEVSPDGKQVYASSTTDRKVVIIDTEKMKAVGEVEAYGEFGIALSGDGSELWIQGPEDNITVYSLKEKKFMAKVPSGSTCGTRRVKFSPDGKLLFGWPEGEDCREVGVYNTALKKKTGAIKVPQLPRFLLYIEK